MMIRFFLFQKTGHGRINFLQFKTFIANLKAWQGVFKMYSKEKAGILRAERLRDALYDVGFQLSSEIMSIIMLKYMRKDGTLRLGDFASAILHLTTAFGENNYLFEDFFWLLTKSLYLIHVLLSSLNRSVPAQGPRSRQFNQN